MWETACCLPGLVGVMPTKVSEAPVPESVQNAHLPLFLCLFRRFSLSTPSKCELFKGLLCALFI